MTVPIKTLNGVYKGFVSDNKDPKKQNRIKVTLQFFNTPKQTQKLSSTDWIDPIYPPGIDLVAPVIGQGVWVLFRAGDPAYPVWIGSFGTHKEQSKKILIKPLLDTTSLTGLTDQVIIVTNQDGTKSVDLLATVLAMANKIKNHETRITALESNLTALHNTLSTKTSPSHTHSSAG